MPGNRSKGRIVGFVALGVLVVLMAIAFYSERPGTAVTAPDESSVTPPPSPRPSTTSLTQSIPEAASATPVTAVASTIVLSPQARLLAERFKCVCGCGDILSTCNCTETPGSRDMKEYLQQLVDEGRAPAEIRNALISRYGQAVLP